MNTPVNKNGFIQINIVVSDIETAAKKWAELLGDRKSTRLNSSHSQQSRMPSSA